MKPRNQTEIEILQQKVKTLEAKNSELETLEAKYLRLSEASFEALFISSNGYCIEQNHAAEKMFGYTNKEATEKKGTDFIAFEDREKVMANILTGFEKPYEAMALRKDGTKFPCRINGKMIPLDGKMVRVTSIRDLTNQKMAEKAIVESEERYRSLIDTSPVAIVVHRDGKLLFVNPAAIRMLGAVEANDLVGRNVLDLTHPNYHHIIASKIEKITKIGNILPLIEAKFIRLDGQEIEVEIQGSSIIYDGEPAIRSSARDITSRKQAENKLRESEEKYRELVENSPDSIVIYVDGRITFVNNECLKLMAAKTKEELLGKSVIQFVSEENRARVIERMKKIAIDVKPLPIEKEKFIRLDGSTVEVEVIAIAIQHENKPAVQLIIRDITLRNLAEAKLIQLSQAVEQSPASTLITDINGNIQYANQKFIDTTGYRIEEIIGKNPRMLKSGHTTKEEYRQLWHNITGGKEWSGEFLNRKKNGELYWELAIIAPIFDSNGIITHYLGVKEDISERKRTEKELIHAKERAQESDRLKSAFLSNMSHEIRTPMNGILGFAELMKQPRLSKEEQSEYIQTIEESCTRMLSIINDIVTISKVESGDMSLDLSHINVNVELKILCANYKSETTKKGISLECKMPLLKTDIILKTDKEKLSIIVNNIVRNAIKFTSKGCIEIGCNIKGAFLEFFVKDTGDGIPSHQKEFIFERFRQGSESITRNYEGAGLGLSISKAYVELLGGEIWVESQLGKGSIFYFTIPYTRF